MHDPQDTSPDPNELQQGAAAPGAGAGPEALPEVPSQAKAQAKSELPLESLPDALRNWQVFDVDSEATTLDGAVDEAVEEPQDLPRSPEPSTVHGSAQRESTPGDRGEDLRGLQIEDRQDDVLVASLDNRRRQVECGGTAEYSVTILNNGGQAAVFGVQIEGWIDPTWLADSSASLLLEPGVRGTLRLPLSPPRRPESEAGEYHFAVCVRSPQHGGRVARIGAVLAVLPYDAVELRFVEGAEPTVSWFKRTAVLPLVVVNRGNRTAQVELQGAGNVQECRLAFGAPSNEVGAPSVMLQPNQSLTVPLRVEVRRPPLIGLQDREIAVPVSAQVATPPTSSLGSTPGSTPANAHGGQARQIGRGAGPSRVSAHARTEISVRPLIGLWQIVGAMGLLAASAVGLVLFLALVYMLAQRSALPQTAGIEPAQAAAPPVIIVNLSQPSAAPSQPQGALAGQAAGQGAAPGAQAFTAGASPDPSLPLVLPDQVSSPDGSAPVAAPASAPASAPAAVSGGAPGAALPFAEALVPGGAAGSAPGGSAPGGQAEAANQTYGQMFQEVGQRFDLDWRMLAAQAYIESGFDSLALSDAGAMGLMQVLPNTWREWAVPVEVSDPFDAYSNVLVAAVYLDHLRGRLADKGYPQKEWMLVAYNWGPDKVNTFLEGGGTWETLPEARRQYATEILRIAQTIP